MNTDKGRETQHNTTWLHLMHISCHFLFPKTSLSFNAKHLYKHTIKTIFKPHSSFFFSLSPKIFSSSPTHGSLQLWWWLHRHWELQHWPQRRHCPLRNKHCCCLQEQCQEKGKARVAAPYTHGIRDEEILHRGWKIDLKRRKAQTSRVLHNAQSQWSSHNTSCSSLSGGRRKRRRRWWRTRRRRSSHSICD